MDNKFAVNVGGWLKQSSNGWAKWQSYRGCE